MTKEKRPSAPKYRLEIKFLTCIFLLKDLASANSSHFLNEPEIDPNRILIEDFVNDEWSDILIEREFRNHMLT